MTTQISMFFITMDGVLLEYILNVFQELFLPLHLLSDASTGANYSRTMS